MGTKMRGLLKGLRYISQKFDENKEPEMHIGYPTDVKHVAHIGWDGPSIDSPSWMKEFKPPHAYQSAPLNVNGEPKENPEIKWVSQDSNRKNLRSKSCSPTEDIAETSIRHSSSGNGSPKSECPTGEAPSSKSKQSRRNSSKSNRQAKDLGSSDSSLPDIPKKSRRKNKESVNGGGGSTRPSRSKKTTTSLPSDPELDTESVSGSTNGHDLITQNSSFSKPSDVDNKKVCNGIS